MLDLRLPGLTFPEVTFGVHEVPWDLRCLLYKGGAAAPAKKVGMIIDAGELGQPLVERIELVRQMHEVIANFLGRGGRRSSAATHINKLRLFVRWVDETGNPLDLESVESSYLHWTDALLQRVRVGEGLSEDSAYGTGLLVGWVLDRMLGRSKPIIRATRLRKARRGTRAVSVKADKQNLTDIRRILGR